VDADARGLGAAVLDLLVFGGEGNPDSPFGTFPQAEAYDPARDVGSGCHGHPAPRYRGRGRRRRALRDGRSDAAGFGPSGASEVSSGTGEVPAIRRLTATDGAGLARGRLVAGGAPGSQHHGRATRIDDRTPDLPPAQLVASGNGRRWRLGTRAARTGFKRFDVRRVAGGDLAVRVVVTGDALPRPGSEATVTLVVAGSAFSGLARVRRAG
jgi:hypothetical protein